MADKPKRASAYGNEQAELVRATCLYVATKLGDMMDDLVIVGGLVPSLIVDQMALPVGVDAHVGTMDLDVGLQLALLDEGRYRTLTERLRDAGFAMDRNEGGNPTRQRWAITNSGTVAVDFLIQPSRTNDRGGRLRNIEPDFAAIIAPGLRCAFRDRQRVTLEGRTLFGEKATREVWACGAGAYVVLKALAFDGRGENKDAYDLFYVLRNFGRVSTMYSPRSSRCSTTPTPAARFTFCDGTSPIQTASVRCASPSSSQVAETTNCKPMSSALSTGCSRAAPEFGSIRIWRLLDFEGCVEPGDARDCVPLAVGERDGLAWVCGEVGVRVGQA